MTLRTVDEQTWEALLAAERRLGYLAHKDKDEVTGRVYGQVHREVERLAEERRKGGPTPS